MASNKVQPKAPSDTISVRLALSSKDRAAFDAWCQRTNGTKAWMANYMVQYFVRTIPPGPQLPALPDADSEPKQSQLL